MQNGRHSAESRKVSMPVAATNKALRATISKEHLSGTHNKTQHCTAPYIINDSQMIAN